MFIRSSAQYGSAAIHGTIHAILIPSICPSVCLSDTYCVSYSDWTDRLAIILSIAAYRHFNFISPNNLMKFNLGHPDGLHRNDYNEENNKDNDQWSI